MGRKALDRLPLISGHGPYGLEWNFGKGVVPGLNALEWE